MRLVNLMVIARFISLLFSDRISAGAYYRGGYIPTETLILIIFLTAAFAVLLGAVAASG
jgi:hypothetical protein